jgi:hypothetical protein
MLFTSFPPLPLSAPPSEARSLEPAESEHYKTPATGDLLSSTQTFLYLYIYGDIYRISYTLLYDTIIA